MKLPLIKLYDFNRCKPTVQVKGVDRKLQWDECNLEGLPPERLPGSMTDCGKIPKGQWDSLPTTFKATDGEEYPIEDIIVLGGK
tara:strand:+ start:895 stop:1146 length:252 start_codon:yes stop_codon:yes gene_type:complete